MDVPPTAQPATALRYAKAIPVLMTACGIDPSARTAFDARIRQLQRLGVLRQDDARPAGRFDYGIIELAALATAVRLMAAFMVPSLAARYVAERWAVLVPALMAGARSALPDDYVARRAIGDAAIIAIEAHALVDLGRQGRHDERYVGALGAVTVVDGAALPATLATFGGAGLMIDTAAYMPALIRAFAEATLATGPELAHELDELRSAR
jgi:hypothetical protein